MERIQECIFNIDVICRSMFAATVERKDLGVPKSSVMYSDSVRYSYIQVCIILDEIDLLHNLAKDDQYLKDTLYIISPIVRAIKKFTGIRKARNSVFAHFNRDSKKKEFYPWWKALREMKLPRAKIEQDIMHVALMAINSTLATRYYDDLKEFSIKSYEEMKSYEKWDMEQKENLNAIPNVFKEPMMELQKRGIEKKMDGFIIDPFILEYEKQKRPFWLDSDFKYYKKFAPK